MQTQLIQNALTDQRKIQYIDGFAFEVFCPKPFAQLLEDSNALSAGSKA